MPACSNTVTVHGDDPARRPRIFTDVTTTTPGAIVGMEIVGASSVVSDLEVHNVATGEGAQGLIVFGEQSTVSHVLITDAGLTNFSGGLGYALVVPATATVTDSALVSSNPLANVSGSTAAAEPLRVQGSGAPGTGLIQNVTSVTGPHAGVTTLDLRAVNGGASAVTVSNFLGVGAVGPIASSNGSGPTITGTLSHALIPTTPTNINGGSWSVSSTYTVGVPSLIDPLGGDVRQKTDSTLTLDKGETATTSTDLDGDPRSAGTAPDIGADELPPLATPLLTSADKVTTHTATVHGTVNPNGAIASYRLEYGTGTAFDHTLPGGPLPRGASPVDVSFDLVDLPDSSTISARLVAIDDAGQQTSTPLSFMTDIPPVATTPAPQTNPSPTPTPTQPAATAIQFATPKLSKVRRGATTVALVSRTAAALTVSVRLDKLSGRAKARLAAHATKHVRLKLTRSARAWLRRAKRHRLRATLVVVAIAADGTHKTLRFRVTVRA